MQAPVPSFPIERGRRSALLDLSKSIVWWLASSAPYWETGDGVAVAATGLEGLLDVRSRRGVRAGCHSIPQELQGLIRRMAAENRLWGQKRIQAESARLGFKVSAGTAAKYMRLRSSRGPSPGCRKFLKDRASNNGPGIFSAFRRFCSRRSMPSL
jgi:hypothetical protein